MQGSFYYTGISYGPVHGKQLPLSALGKFVRMPYVDKARRAINHSEGA